MKKLSAVICLLVMSSSFALSNQECVEVYRDGYLDLRTSIQDFNNKTIDSTQFSAEVGAIGTSVRALRAACYFTESPDVSECVGDYKEVYQDLRDRVKLSSVISGNQTEINISENVNAQRNDSNGISGLFNRFRNAGADVVKRGKLTIIDAKCL